MAFPIALQLYSVRHEMKNDVRATLQQVKQLGYDGVEFAGLFDIAPIEIKQMCEEIGLVPISAHVSINDMFADADATFAKYAAVGTRFVAIPSLPEEYRPGTDKFPEVVKNVAMLGAVAKKLGLQLLYHNHDFEFLKIDGKYALDILYDEVSADLLQTELDMCWVNVGGENPSEYLLKYTGRSPVVHLKDFVGEKSKNMYELIGIQKKAEEDTQKFEFRPVGYGKQDFPSILEASKKAGASWVVVEQDKASMDLTPMECAEKSRTYLKSIGN